MSGDDAVVGLGGLRREGRAVPAEALGVGGGWAEVEAREVPGFNGPSWVAAGLLGDVGCPSGLSLHGLGRRNFSGLKMFLLNGWMPVASNAAINSLRRFRDIAQVTLAAVTFSLSLPTVNNKYNICAMFF